MLLCASPFEVRTGPIFNAVHDGVEARLLDMLDAGRPVPADSEQPWAGVYGPALIDSVLDLLLDQATGPVRFLPEPGWSESDLARTLALVAGYRRRWRDLQGRTATPALQAAE